MAGGEGFEPSQPEPESDVLPLDDPPTSEKLNRALCLSQEAVCGMTPHPKPVSKGAMGNEGMYQLAKLRRLALLPQLCPLPLKGGEEILNIRLRGYSLNGLVDALNRTFFS